MIVRIANLGERTSAVCTAWSLQKVVRVLVVLHTCSAPVKWTGMGIRVGWWWVGVGREDGWMVVKGGEWTLSSLESLHMSMLSLICTPS
jgi:hypothetical protein